jgi:hypothetical protein
MATVPLRHLRFGYLEKIHRSFIVQQSVHFTGSQETDSKRVTSKYTKCKRAVLAQTQNDQIC